MPNAVRAGGGHRVTPEPIVILVHDEASGERVEREFAHWMLAVAALQTVFSRPGWDPMSRDVVCRRVGRRLEITRRLPS